MMSNQVLQHWEEVLRLLHALSKSGGNKDKQAFQLKQTEDRLEDASQHLSSLTPAGWRQLLLDRKVVQRVCAFCNHSAGTPGQIGAFQTAYVACLTVLIDKAFEANLLTADQHSNTIPRSLAKQLHQSGFLQHLPKLLSGASEQLAAVQDSEVVAWACSTDDDEDSDQVSPFTSDGRLRVCILHSHVNLLLTLHQHLTLLPLVGPGPSAPASPALGVFDSSTLPVLQLSVTVLRHMSHIIDLLASVQAPGLRPDVFQTTHKAFFAAFSAIVGSADFLQKREKEGAQPTELSQAIMRSQLPLEAISILLLAVMYPGQRRETGSTARHPPGLEGMHSSPAKQHLAGHLTECGPQHSSASMEQWRPREAPELAWTAAHQRLLRALGISPKGLAYIAAYSLRSSPPHARVLVHSYQVFGLPLLVAALDDVIVDQPLCMQRSGAAGNQPGGQRQQQQPQGIVADPLEVHFCLPSVMLHWAAHQVPTQGTGPDGFSNCCRQAAFSSNMVLLLALMLSMRTLPKAADHVSGPTAAAQASKEAERKDAAAHNAARPEALPPSLAPTQLAEIIKLTGQLSQGLLSHMQAAASANTSAAGSSSSSSSSTRARGGTTPTTSTSSRQPPLTTHAAGLPSGQDDVKTALELLLSIVCLLRETSDLGGQASSFVLQASNSTTCSSSQDSPSQGSGADPGSASVAAAWRQHAPQLMALAEACMRVDKSPQYRLFRMEQRGVVYKPGTDILMDSALQAAAGSPQQQLLLLGMLTSMLKVALHSWKPGYCTAQGVASGIPPAEARLCMVYVSSVAAHIMKAAATGCAAEATADACSASSDISHTSNPSQRDQSSAGTKDSASSTAGSSSVKSSLVTSANSVNSTTISDSSEPSSSAAHLLPCLMLWGRCLLACAAQLWLVAAAVQAGGQDEDNEGMCIQIECTLSKLFEVFQPSLQLVLANSSLSAGLTAAGGCNLLPTLQHLASMDIDDIFATMLEQSDYACGPSDSNAAVILEVVQQLRSAGRALSAPACRTICNNPRCPVTTGLSERQLVRGHSCCCSACRTARYCCKACQTKAWKLHKPVCKAITAAAAAGGGIEQADVA